MSQNANLEDEQFYWDLQVERHQVGRKMRKLIRKIKYKPYKRLARYFGVSRQTIWDIANNRRNQFNDQFLEKLSLVTDLRKKEAKKIISSGNEL